MYKYRRLIVSIIAGLLVFSILAGFVVMMVSGAKKSDELKKEIEELQSQSKELKNERKELEKEIEKTKGQTLTIVEQKAQVDQDIELTRREVENVNEQVHAFNLLIAEKQADLDDLKQEQTDLLASYRRRMRALQEHGNISFLQVMLQAKSFADMLNCRVMIQEIASADQKMMEDLRDMAAEVMVAKDELAAEKAKIELKKAELVESEALLEEKRAESDRLLAELNSDKERLIEECEKYEAEEALLHDEIAKLEAERTEALRKEWEEAERKRKEEEEKKKQEEANKQNQNNNNNGNSGNNSGSSNNDSNPPASNEKFFFPLEYCSKLTSPYGYRVHPVTGKYHLHNGVDLAAAKGTKIYATKSGKVTTAVYNYSWGYYVVINHLDGFSSLYGHMTNFVVSEGQYVKRGQLIGYVGSTGWSTGNHLHFTVYYNGATVNPMNYISMP